MHFTIITPSLNQLEFLKRCIASVADQATDGVGHEALGVGAESIELHHHVQDGGATDGTRQFLEKLAEVDSSSLMVDGGMENLNNEESAAYQLSFDSEADEGMYDALNKGIEYALGGTRYQARGISEPNNHQPSAINSSNQVVAWLNCDEQYLPGTLQTVAKYFTNHPEVDVLCGNALVVDESGGLTGFWKCMPLRRRYVQSGYLYNLSCSMFFRVGVFKQGLRFNTEYKALGDQELIIRLLLKGARTALTRKYLAAYTFLPQNLSEQGFAMDELGHLQSRLSGISKALKPIWRTIQRIERVLRGCRRQRFPVEYELYIDPQNGRKNFKSGRVPCCWPGARKNG